MLFVHLAMPRKKITPETLIEKYVDTLLMHPEELGSVFRFAKHIKIQEGEFYPHFASFEALEGQFFANLFEVTLDSLYQDDEYMEFDDRNKLLLFYYTLFENFKLNRSAIKAMFKQPFIRRENERKLKPLQGPFETFMDSFNFGPNIIDQEQFKKYESIGVRKATWLHFIMLINFWLDDDSKDFEDTDVLIEKSLNTGLDFIESNVINQFLDLGKFLIKDRLAL